MRAPLPAMLAARPRLAFAACVLAVGPFVLPDALRLSTRFLIAWDAAACFYLALVVAMMASSDMDALQRRADREDPGAVAVLGLSMLAAFASFVAIAAELRGLHDGGSRDHAGTRLGLAAGTVLVSWLFVHASFALHYAHDFYAGAEDRGGLDFPGASRPDYWDFLYFAFTMGAASQTSDVRVTAARTRRFVLAHTVLSFLFNTTVLALAVNVGASLL